MTELRIACSGTLREITEVLGKYSGDAPDFVKSYATEYIAGLGINTYMFRNLQTMAGLRQYLTMADKEGFDWVEQFITAQQTIQTVNAANPGLNLETNYDLPTLIEALANQNNPDQLHANIELMQEPTLVIIPQGLTLDSLRAPLEPNGNDIVTVEPCINDLYQPAQQRPQAGVCLVDAGDLLEMSTQPTVVSGAATDNNNRLSDQRLQALMEELGMKLDAHSWALLAVMVRHKGKLLDLNTYSILGNRFDGRPNYVAFADFVYVRSYFFASGRFYANVYARLRASVMAEI